MFPTNDLNQFPSVGQVIASSTSLFKVPPQGQCVDNKRPSASKGGRDKCVSLAPNSRFNNSARSYRAVIQRHFEGSATTRALWGYGASCSRNPAVSSADPWIKVTVSTAHPGHREIQPLISQPRGGSSAPARSMTGLGVCCPASKPPVC